MDQRDRIAMYGRVFDAWHVDADAQVAILFDEDADRDVHLHLKWEVCSTCGGKGTHVNPSIDANGLTSDDFASDPEFRSEYFSGTYDVQCYGCSGRTTVLVVDREHTAAEDLSFFDGYERSFWDGIACSEAERRAGA
jgi:hypothetical protein